MTRNDTPPIGSATAERSLPRGRLKRDLSDLGKALVVLSTLGHEKMTVRQLLFFQVVSYAHFMGRAVTISQIIEDFEDTGALGKSIKKSFSAFLPPTPRDPDNLGWIEQVHDENDRRVRYLKLTPEGEDVWLSAFEAVHEG